MQAIKRLQAALESIPLTHKKTSNHSYHIESIPVYEGITVINKSGVFLEIEGELYKIHIIDLKQQLTHGQKVSGQLFMYSTEMTMHMGFAGYVYPGSLRKI